MNLKDFYLVAQRILDILDNNDPIPQYQELVNNLNNIRVSPTAELQDAINNNVNSILSINSLVEQELEKIPHSMFVVEKLNITDHIGAGAKERLEGILRNEAYIAPSSVERLIQEISSMKNQLRTIIDEFNKFGISFDSEESALLSVEYMGSSSVETTSDLKSRLGDLETIIRAYARLTNSPEAFAKPKISSISKSSPLTVDLGNGVAIYSTLVFIAKGVTWSMDRVEQANRIKIQKEKLKQEKMTTRLMEKEFEKLEKQELSEENVKKFVNELYQEASPSTDTGVKAETEKDLCDATKLLLKIIKSGSSIKVFPPQQQSEDEETEADKQLAAFSISMGSGYKKISAQQEQLKLLSPRSKEKRNSQTEGEASKPESDGSRQGES